MLGAIPLPQRARLGRLAKFGIVGVSGIGVNLVVQAALIELLGINYVVAAILSTQVSSTWNFLGAEHWVFEPSSGGNSRLGRYLAFMAMSNSALLLRVPFMWVLTSVLGIFYTLSNLASLAMLTLARFLLSDGLIWRTSGTSPVAASPVHASDQAHVAVAPPPLRPYEPQHLDPHDVVESDAGPAMPGGRRRSRAFTHPERWLLAGCVVAGTLLRVWQLTGVGLNSDEAVYAGQAAAIAGDRALIPFFPVIRAHPLLFQGLLSVAYHFGTSPLIGRLASVAFGVGTIVLAYLVTKLLYGTRAALLAALIVALMPYQIVVDRQILLDAPTAFFVMVSLYLLVRYALDQRPGWLVAAAGAVGVAVLSKETAVVLLASSAVFVALSPEIRIRLRHALAALAVFAAVVVVWPLIIVLSGRSETGTSYLSWQLFRRPNHSIGFYATTLPWYIGPLVLLLAGVALLVRWRTDGWSWREWLLLSWSAVPFIFFQLWPVKGFQYLLGAALPVALLAGAGLSDVIGWLAADQRWSTRRVGARLGVVAVGVVALSLCLPAIADIQSLPTTTMLAGTGGVPGGREAGTWIGRNAPGGAEVVTIGPSMANLIEFYGHRRAYGLSVSPNARNRNPSYVPLRNPDLALRSGQVQYIVWDAYSGSRTSFFDNRLSTYVQRYHGHVVFTYDVGGQSRVKVFEVGP